MNIKSNKLCLKLSTINKTWIPVFCAIVLFAACKKEKTPEPAAAAKNITFSLQLADVNTNLSFNDSAAFMYQVEYSWSIYIDSDSNSSTGDYNGYDVKITMGYSKQSNTPMYGDLLSYTYKNTYTLEKSMGTSAHKLTASIDAAANCLLLTGNKNWPELASVNAGDKMKVEAFNLFHTDYCAIGKFPDDILDVQGDVPEPYIDIIALKIIQ